MTRIKYTIITTRYSFKCPYCSDKVLAGDACLETEKNRVCIKHLPKRRLVPKAEYEKRIKDQPIIK